MDKLVYIYYVVLAVVLFWGAKVFTKKTWNDDFMSLSQTKALQGFTALCIMFHHISQKTCAYWLDRKYIHPGLEFFVDIGFIFVGIFLFCSGYGLLKSVQTKPDYLKGFIRKRIVPVILAFYSTGIIFLIIRFFMGENLSTTRIIYYVTGLQLSNPNSWYVIALPIFYFGFYFAFKNCKKENTAILITSLVVFVYTLIGTFTNHNNFWMRGEWWYNSVHLFPLGLLFAKFEKTIVEKIKKHYWIYLITSFIGIFVFFVLSKIATGFLSYYGENFHANYIVLRRWGCLLSQILVSCSAVFFVFMLGMKIRIGNKFLAFMGSITLEFYLLHGIFIELFGYNFIDTAKSIYYIQNVALFVLVVFIPSIPASVLLQRFHKWFMRMISGTKKQKIEGKNKNR